MNIEWTEEKAREAGARVARRAIEDCWEYLEESEWRLDDMAYENNLHDDDMFYDDLIDAEEAGKMTWDEYLAATNSRDLEVLRHAKHVSKALIAQAKKMIQAEGRRHRRELAMLRKQFRQQLAA